MFELSQLTRRGISDDGIKVANKTNSRSEEVLVAQRLQSGGGVEVTPDREIEERQGLFRPPIPLHQPQFASGQFS